MSVVKRRADTSRVNESVKLNQYFSTYLFCISISTLAMGNDKIWGILGDLDEAL